LCGQPEPVKVPQKKAESGCFLNCEIRNLGKQYLDGALPGDLVRVEQVNSRARPITASSVPRAGW
jgi:membrane-bound lytic murein transglycosylase A